MFNKLNASEHIHKMSHIKRILALCKCEQHGGEDQLAHSRIFFIYTIFKEGTQLAKG